MTSLSTIPETSEGEDSSEPNEPRVVQNLPAARYRNFEADSEGEEEYYYNDANWREEPVEYTDGGEYGEVTWFATGVRVGVGIGLGICIGLGIGFGVLLSSYRVSNRNIRR